MKNIIFILSLILFVSCHGEKHKDGSASQAEEAEDLSAISLTEKLDSLYHTGVFNGFSVAVVDTTGVLYNQGFGYADKSNQAKFSENTIINIASISKVFVGVALLKSEELGFVNLDDPINKYLPFEVVNPRHLNEEISIRHLATHSSSIVDTDIYMETDYINKDDVAIADGLKEKYELYYQNSSENWIPLSKYLERLLSKEGALYNASTFADRKPGEVYEYSNIGTALCALVIEYASGKPFNEFTKEHIFKPLEMSSTGWFFEEVDSSNYSKLYYDNEELPYYRILSYPDGSLITSSTDLSKFLVDLLKGYSGKGSVLKDTSYKELFKSQLVEAAFKEKKDYNVGLFTEKELAFNVIGHSGGDPGTNTLMYFNTETRIGKVMILNTDSQKENSMGVYWGIWNALDGYKKPVTK